MCVSNDRALVPRRGGLHRLDECELCPYPYTRGGVAKALCTDRNARRACAKEVRGVRTGRYAAHSDDRKGRRVRNLGYLTERDGSHGRPGLPAAARAKPTR